MAATVSASAGAPDSPSTAPNATCPDGVAKRAMRTTAQATRVRGGGPERAILGG